MIDVVVAVLLSATIEGNILSFVVRRVRGCMCGNVRDLVGPINLQFMCTLERSYVIILFWKFLCATILVVLLFVI